MFLFVELSIQCEEAIEILRAIPDADATTSKSAYTPNGIIPGTFTFIYTFLIMAATGKFHVDTSHQTDFFYLLVIVFC